MKSWKMQNLKKRTLYKLTYLNYQIEKGFFYRNLMKSKKRRLKWRKNWIYYLRDWCLLNKIDRIKYWKRAFKIAQIKKTGRMNKKIVEIKIEYSVKIDKLNKIDNYNKMKVKKKKLGIKCGDKMLQEICLNCHKLMKGNRINFKKI